MSQCLPVFPADLVIHSHQGFQLVRLDLVVPASPRYHRYQDLPLHLLILAIRDYPVVQQLHGALLAHLSQVVPVVLDLQVILVVLRHRQSQ